MAHEWHDYHPGEAGTCVELVQRPGGYYDTCLRPEDSIAHRPRYDDPIDLRVATYEDEATEAITVRICTEDGCLVVDTERHDHWHDWVGR